MRKEELFAKFQLMFPDWAKCVVSYKKIGPKVLAMDFVFEKNLEEPKKCSRVFLYISEDNWQFGTKLWRKRPEFIKKNKVLLDGFEAMMIDKNFS